MLFATLSAEAINIGYLNTDYGIPLLIDKFAWSELENNGRTKLAYNLDGQMDVDGWVGEHLVTLETQHLPPGCLNRLRNEFEDGAKSMDLFVMKKDEQKQLLRTSSSNDTMLLLSNSRFLLEFRGLYRSYREDKELPEPIPKLRSSESQRFIHGIDRLLSSKVEVVGKSEDELWKLIRLYRIPVRPEHRKYYQKE